MAASERWSELWRKNLERDEQVVWSGATPEELRFKEIRRERLTALIVLMASLVAGVTLLWNLLHPPQVHACAGTGCWAAWPSVSDMLRLPSYVLGILVCGTVTLVAVIGLLAEAQPEQVYAVTSTRLLACGSEGQILDQLSVGDLAGLRWKVGISTPILEVRRKRDPQGRGPLVIRNVADVVGLEKALNAWRSAA